MSGWTLQRRLGVSFVVIAAVVVVIVVLVSTALVRLNAARDDRVERYGPALLASETLAKAYSDQETGVRGYVSSGRLQFLEPYQDGLAAEQAQITLLRRLLQGRPDLLERLAAVDSAAMMWQQQVADPSIAKTREQGARATTLTEIENGRERFDAVRAALADLQRPVRDARDASSRSLNRQTLLLTIVLVVSLFLLIVVAVVAWVALRRTVTDPVRDLGTEVDRVEAGELTHQVSLGEAPAELRVLAEQVDRMRVRIVQELALAEQARRDALDARAQLEEQALDLRRSNAELEQFAYVASHDLQEPLRKVASFCQLLERRYKGQLDDRGEQYIEFAVDGAKRMQRLINDLLAFSRVGRLTNEFTDVPLDEALAQATRQLAETIEETGAVVTHDALPTVRGEGSLLVQLFQNLIGNGIKFRGEAAPRVHIAVRQDGEMWEFSCSDNGIGIEPQYADKIFVIFQRLHGRDVYGGTGIGLSMCKKIVEYHGGRMWLDTAATSGATFRWTLPVAVPADGTSMTSGDFNGERTRNDDVGAGPQGRGAVGGGRPR